MELVFIHGWGFTADFWNPVCALLPQFRHRRVDLGFYGNPSDPVSFDDRSILVGHSLGFVHGLSKGTGWKGWIAVNSFPRFVHQENKSGCVTPAQLREIKFGLSIAGTMALQRFYGLIDAEAPQGSSDIERLQTGLDELRDSDVMLILETLDVPGLVLAARNDPLVPIATSEALGQISPESNILWHETGGHTLPLKDPAWCAKAIDDFAQSLSG